MDIHRCRFVPYPASPIKALAFSHTSPTNPNSVAPTTLRLALGRANGDIEIWNPRNGNWVQETILRGSKERSIEGLAWTHDLEEEVVKGQIIPGQLRLFSIGYSTVVTEWDLARGRPLQHSSGNYGEIWCIAAQPRWQAHNDVKQANREGPRAEQLIAFGCGDGTLALLSTAGGLLQYERTLPRPSGKKARALCIAFLNRQKLVAGFSDSTIRIFDIQNRAQVISMSLGAGPKDGPSEILVWNIRCLRDGTIVSGDSSGEVKIWDSTTSTLVQRIKGHNADVLSLATSADGMSLLSGGMDRKTVLYKKETSGKRKNRWTEVKHQRLHSNDVNAMASYQAANLAVAVSGGADTVPIIVPLERLGLEHSRTLPNLPAQPALASVPAKRLLLSWWDREITIWRVKDLKGEADEDDDLADATTSRRLVAKLALKGEENITSTSISHDGTIMAVATISNIKIFGLKEKNSSHGLRVRKLEIPDSISNSGAKILSFSPDSKWLYVVQDDSTCQVHRITKEEGAQGGIDFPFAPVKLPRKPSRPDDTKAKLGTYGQYLQSIYRAAWSSDSRILVASDLSGNLDVWVLEGHEDLPQNTNGVNMNGDSSPKRPDDSDDEEDEEAKPQVILGQHWIKSPYQLDKLPSAALVLSFRPQKPSTVSTLTNGDLGVHPTRHNPHAHSHSLPNGEDRLIAVTMHHQILEYSVVEGRLTKWSRDNPVSLLPPEFRDTRDRAMGAVWDVSASRERLWLYGTSWLWMFDLSRDLPRDLTAEPTLTGGQLEAVTSNKKRKRSDEDAERRELMKNTSGAGSRAPTNEQGGLGSGMTTIKNGARQFASFDPEPPKVDGEDMDVDDAEDSGGEDALDLVRMRRGVAQDGNASTGELVATKPQSSESEDEDMAIDKTRNTDNPPYWRTWKYRPILGMVPIGGDDASKDTDDDQLEGLGNIEVALVERPHWDLPVALRWEGNQEYNK